MTPATTNGIAATPVLALRIGRGRTLLAVRDLADASRVYRAACDRHEAAKGEGSSTMPEGRVYDVAGTTPRLVAKVSWNGNVWAPVAWTPGMEPLYDAVVARTRGGVA